MRKRFLLTLGMVAAMSVSIVGCGGSSSSSNEKTTESQKTEAANSTENNDSDDSSDIDGMGDLYEYIGENSEDIPYTISPKAKTFLNDHPEVCAVKKVNSIKKYVDASIEYKKVEKNQNKFGDKIMKTPECYVIKVNESGEGNSTITEIQVCDADSNYYYVIYNGSLDIYKEDTVQIYGVPVGMTSFENVGGGTTVSLIIAGSYVHKTNE